VRVRRKRKFIAAKGGGGGGSLLAMRKTLTKKKKRGAFFFGPPLRSEKGAQKNRCGENRQALGKKRKGGVLIRAKRGPLKEGKGEKN